MLTLMRPLPYTVAGPIAHKATAGVALTAPPSAHSERITQLMIRITTTLDAKEIVAALHAQNRATLLEFTRDLLVSNPDSTLLEEVADLLLAELERRASST